MNSPDESGLGLFDDMASAAGNFPTALRGYDRTAVDDYVRALEAKVVNTRRHASSLQAQVEELSEQVSDASSPEDEVDYADLGGRATDILRLAEEQARELVDLATVDAEKAREDARREADTIRQQAHREGGDLKSTGVAELDRLREQLENEAQAEIQRAQSEAAALVAAARRQAEALGAQAAHEAQTARQTAYLDTEESRRGAEREVAGLRAEVAEERERALAELRAVHEKAVAQTSAMLAEATEHNATSTERLEADITEASRIRTEAIATAEQITLDAQAQAEERVQAARQQAATLVERTQQEFAWRKQQLKRDTDLLAQRKQAVLNQLSSLSALAQQTASSFPDLEDLGDFDAEEGDRTVLRRVSSPAGPPDQSQDHGPTQPPPDQTPGLDETVRAESPSAPDRHPEPVAETDATRGEGPAVEVDGDTTILMPAGGPLAGPTSRPATPE